MLGCARGMPDRHGQVIARLEDDEVIAVYEVDESVLVIDSS